ncbi:MurT ligase domain-containing protein [Aneurinibacillus sp. Ricciae_BoGa-3]|uniref:MurT ligase domain-containing protein n=1 Tax=Aneurinibacillus sp. Ricciae_BoGa-3 TaxID=3022697 RepID=UPI002340FAB5|nr:MurT ligase domain-containing protein [Aneurinibacillus sp. Ricciae_BoGa-3]WCK53399.1 MurT ligase domain-containing protein [Aneurinibacillus sp. Ricciae_BoGa-3]
MLKSSVAILSGKIAGKASKIIGNGGSNIPGIVARKIDPSLLRSLAVQVEHIILVSGTNGKTTTANLLASILKAAGKRVVNNEEGANLLTGITACLVNNATFWGKLAYDYAVIEVDEASLLKMTDQVRPEMVVITNFFRDQLDRFGEIDILIDRVLKSIEPTDAKLLLNADDPFVMRLGLMDKEKVFFGVGSEAFSTESGRVSESKFCPVCGNELQYKHVHYGQLGDYECTCGFARPVPRYEVEEIQAGDEVSFTVAQTAYRLSLQGIHNVYNALAAVACARELGVTEADIAKGLQSYKASNGRMQTFEFNGYPYTLNLVKNPAGVNISLAEVLSDEEPKQVAFVLNDLVYDGFDISWIWDADFERLNRGDIERVVCSGLRARDMALRMKYAGIDEDKINVIESNEGMVDECLSHPMKTYILPNYTALEPVKKYLEKKANA